MATKKLNILVVDDHAVFREGMVSLLSSFDFVNRALESDDPEDILTRIKLNTIDVLFLDLEMPKISGLDLLDQINELELHEKPKIIIVSVLEDKQSLINSYKRGINGYIPKSTSKREMLRLFERLEDDDDYYSNNVSKFIFSEAFKPSTFNKSRRNKVLTNLEIKVIIYNCYQYTIKEIAAKLFTTDAAVKTHRYNIYKKTDCKNMVGLAYFALQQELITLKDIETKEPEDVIERIFRR